MLTQPSHGTIVKTGKTEEGHILRVARRLKHASFLVKAASCPALILGASLELDRNDLAYGLLSQGSAETAHATQNR